MLFSATNVSWTIMGWRRGIATFVALTIVLFVSLLSSRVSFDAAYPAIDG
jgi:hypothetical protein